MANKGRKDNESVIASCADADEVTGEELQSGRKVANLGVKRSDPTLVKPVPVDLASDSGYSSRTQVTNASADSAASIRAKVELAQHTGALQELSVNRQLAPNDFETHSQVSGSTASSKPKKRTVCKEPNCDKCVAAREAHAAKLARRARKEQKLSVDTNVSPVKSREESPVKQPHPGTIVRQKPAIHQQPPQPRRRDSQQARERPTSMYGRPPPDMGGPPPPSGYFQDPRRAYPHPGHPGAMIMPERNGPPVSARGARGAPGYNAGGGTVRSARRVMPNTVVVADNRPPQPPPPPQVDDRAAKIAQQMAAAQRIQSMKQPQVSEEEYTDEEDDEEVYSDEEQDDDDDYDSADDTQDELMAAAAMRARMKKQKANVPALEAQLQAARAHEAQLRAAQAHDVQAQERQRLMIAQQQRRAMEEAARRQQMSQGHQMPHIGQMGPPPPPPPPAGLPTGLMGDQTPQTPSGLSMRRALPQITYPNGRRQSQLDPMGMDPDFRQSLRSQTPSGSSQHRRPSLASSGATKATSYSHPITSQPHVTVEGHNGRRMSYLGAEPRQQLQDMHSGFAQTQNHNLQQLISDLVSRELEQYQRPQEQERRVEFNMNDQIRNALSYQHGIDQVGHATRRDTLTQPTHPLTQDALRRNAGIPSMSGSSRSYRTSDDLPSLVSAGHRLTAGSEAGDFTVNGDEMKMRIDTSNGFQMEFDGRLVMLNPIGDGSTAELIIGGKRGERADPAYTSTRGSQATKSVINRQPSQRQRRNTRDDDYDDDDRTERRTVYRKDERRRDREEREAEDREARIRELQRLERDHEDRLAEAEEAERRRRKKERKERAARKEKEAEAAAAAERRRAKRSSKYVETATEDDDDYTSEYSSEEEDRRTQKTTRRRAQTNAEREPPRRERRRAPSSPDRRPRDDRNYQYPAGYSARAGFTTPQF